MVNKAAKTRALILPSVFRGDAHLYCALRTAPVLPHKRVYLAPRDSGSLHSPLSCDLPDAAMPGLGTFSRLPVPCSFKHFPHTFHRLLLLRLLPPQFTRWCVPNLRLKNFWVAVHSLRVYPYRACPSPPPSPSLAMPHHKRAFNSARHAAAICCRGRRLRACRTLPACCALSFYTNLSLRTRVAVAGIYRRYSSFWTYSILSALLRAKPRLRAQVVSRDVAKKNGTTFTCCSLSLDKIRGTERVVICMPPACTLPATSVQTVVPAYSFNRASPLFCWW